MPGTFLLQLFCFFCAASGRRWQASRFFLPEHPCANHSSIDDCISDASSELGFKAFATFLFAALPGNALHSIGIRSSAHDTHLDGGDNRNSKGVLDKRNHFWQRVSRASEVYSIDGKPPRGKPRSETPTEEGNKGFEAFVGFLYSAAEETAKVAVKVAGETAKVAAKGASNAAENWTSSGWQLKKKAGSVFPEIKPKAVEVISPEVVVADRALDMGVSSDMELEMPQAGDLSLSVKKETTSILSSSGAVQLQNDFYAFLSPREGSSYNTTENGEIIFASRADLANLVTEFAYAKLEKVAAASRALARYVEDLEEELEEADSSAIQLRRDLKASTQKLADAQAKNDAMEQQAKALASKLASAEQDLKSQQSVLEEAELAAERRALASLTTDSIKDTVELERDLVAAENSLEELEASKAQLQTEIMTLTEKREQAEVERRQEAELVRTLEQKAELAERKAEATVATLTASEREIAQLKAELSELKGALQTSNAATLGDSAKDAAKAVNLANEIETQLLASRDDGNRKALSRMRKADLIIECQERKVSAEGTVPELRARLRIQRMRDKSVSFLVEKGCSEGESRDALTSVGWNVTRALESMQKL